MSKITRALERAKREREAAQRAEEQNPVDGRQSLVDSDENRAKPVDSDTSKEKPTTNDQDPTTNELRIHEPRTTFSESGRRVRSKIVLQDGRPKKRAFKTVVMVLFLAVIFLGGGVLYLKYQRGPFVAVSDPVDSSQSIVVNDQRPTTNDVVEKTRDVHVVPVRETEEIVAEEVPVPVEARDPNRLLIASFDSGRLINELGGDIYSTQSDGVEAHFKTAESFNSVHARLGEGFALKLRYNVDHPTKIIENGLVMDLGGLPVDEYQMIAFFLKGDRQQGHTAAIMVEVVGDVSRKAYKLSNVAPRWEEVSIPLAQFKEENAVLREFRITFRTDIATVKKGIIYIDDVVVKK